MPRKIIAKISDRDIQKIKQELQNLMKTETGISITQIRFGSLGDEAIISFNADDDHYDLIFERMKQLGANLLVPVIKKAVKKVIVSENNLQPSAANINDKLKTTDKQNPAQVLESAISNGDYETLIKVSKDIRNRPELIRRAKDNIYVTIIKEIEKVHELGKKSGIERKDSIERLVKISGDKDIKAMYKIDALKFAGLMAVDLCALSLEYISYLVQLCNNNAIPNIVNIKAAIALSNLIFSSESQSTDELGYAVKYLNINWLLIAFDVVIVELSDEEKYKFIKLIEAVKEKR